MIWGLLVIGCMILIDQITKVLTVTYMQLGAVNPFLTPVLEIHHHRNFGASWGMLEGYSWLFVVATIVALIVLGYLFSSVDFKKKKIYSYAVCLLIAGVFGNALDRLFRVGANGSFFSGYVVDMLHMPFLDFIPGFPNFIFNIADVFLTFGIIFFAIDLIFLDDKRKKKEL